MQIAVSILLLVAVASWPYGFYQILRWVVAISAGIFAYEAFNSEKNMWGWIFITILILFNPILPIHLEKETWQTLNVLVAIVYAISIKSISIVKSN